MNHLTLTDQELKDVAAFWSNYLNTGGEGEPPTPFQFEALNDHRLRDALLFWQAGGVLPALEPDAAKAKFFNKARPAYELLGPTPTNFDNVMNGVSKAIGVMNEEGAEADSTDTGTVLILAYLIWATLLGSWQEAREDAQSLRMVNIKYATVKAQNGGKLAIWHSDPLVAVSEAILTLSRVAETDPEKAREVAMDCFCVPVGSPAYEYIMRASTALEEKERIAE